MNRTGRGTSGAVHIDKRGRSQATTSARRGEGQVKRRPEGQTLATVAEAQPPDSACLSKFSVKQIWRTDR
jgi:hypothetical protein